MTWTCDVPRALSGWYVHIYVDTYHIPPNDSRIVGRGACIRFGLEGPSQALTPLSDVTSFTTSSEDPTFHSAREGCIALCAGCILAASPFELSYCSLSGGAGPDLTHADLGRLIQKVKQPAQIRAVLLADSKAMGKISKGSDEGALRDIFVAVAKRLGLTPKVAVPPTSPVAPPNPSEEEWTTVVKRRGAAPKPKLKVSCATPSRRGVSPSQADVEALMSSHENSPWTE